MQHYPLAALASLLALLTYFATIQRVGRARQRFNIVAPAVTGHPEFERNYRVQMNALEWLPIFLVSLWLFAIYWSDWVAALLGLVWIIGRVIYMLAYTKDPATRSTGFLIQMAATAVLFVGALGKVIWVAVALHL
ncbi:MAG: MAPEG family protein [Caulobacteraceae bacterium]